MNVAQRGLSLLIRAYQVTLSPALAVFFGPAGRCRYTPSCSQYALEAVQAHGAMAGSYLALKRLCRCHPWGPFGEDPVPLPAGKTPRAEKEKEPNRLMARGCGFSSKGGRNSSAADGGLNWHLDFHGHGS
jgi:uncharacterized protein